MNGLGEYSRSTPNTTSYEQALTVRGQELNRTFGLGAFSAGATYIDAHELAARVNAIESTPGPVPDAFERAVANRRTDGFLSGDDHVRLDPADLPTVVATSSPSGREVEWPQIGVGFGIGLLLMLGVVLTWRLMRVRRPLAH